MNRFYCSSVDIQKDFVYLRDKSELHHLRDVLRAKIGDELMVFSEKGREYRVKISAIKPQYISAKIKEVKFTPPAKTLVWGCTIACAIPKKARFDDIVDKLTQLGVDRIIPLVTERTIVKWDIQQKDRQIKRWQKIALSASCQSQRNTLPGISPVCDIKDIINRAADFDLKLISTLAGERKTLHEALRGVLHEASPDAKPKNILALIGPEGDFSQAETALAQRAGFIPVSLGSLVLRVDTAAIAVASFIRLSS